MPDLARAISLAVLVTPLGAALAAEPEPRAGERDQYELVAHGETHAELFRRALLPGPEGALIETDTVLPLYQALALRVRNLDTELGKDSLDLELSAWGQTMLGELGPERRIDGDLQTAFVRLKRDALSLRAGRQLVFGGAARMSRFDGLFAGADLGQGFGAGVYAGLTVLPRWQLRRGYHYLGNVDRSQLSNPDLLEPLGRESHLTGGGRLSFTRAGVSAELSFHEEHEQGGLARRNLGAAGRLEATDELWFAADAIAELDARRLAEARVSVAATPLAEVSAEVAAAHSEPALFLSRNSILSVFSDASYDELGASAVVRATPRLILEAEGAGLFYELGHPGGRAGGSVRLVVDRARGAILRFGYQRLLAPDNGYQALRISSHSRLWGSLSGSTEAYAYVYDEPIRGYLTSNVYAGTLSYAFSRAFDVLLGGSLGRSPYAELDAQASLRLSYGLYRSSGGLR